VKKSELMKLNASIDRKKVINILAYFEMYERFLVSALPLT